jgi:hypothetical protein
MTEMFPEDVTLVREKFPVGTEVQFIDSTLDDYACRRGDCGMVLKVTLDGEIYVQWDRGFITTVVPGRESVEVVLPEYEYD